MIAALTLMLAAITWPMDKLFTAPKTFDASAYATNGVQVVFYEGLPYKGRETRVFAYYGVPAHAAGEKVPAMVLVHGGGGSAFYRWVKFWNDRGYAAISMDTCGKISGNTIGSEQRQHYPHDWSGPAGWGGFRTPDVPDEDHWVYHAVAAVIRGHSFLRNLPDVDPAHIGITGVSWGGVLTCIAASLDDRFAFAAPVYGCGDIFARSHIWADIDAQMGSVYVSHWKTTWDPLNYLPRAKVPFHWLVGTNDACFALPSVEDSRAALTEAHSSATVRVRMVHTHGRVSEEAAELLALADHHLRGGADLPHVGDVKVANSVATASYTQNAARQAVRAVLDYTLDKPDAHDSWYARNWQSKPAELAQGQIRAQLPHGTQAFYLNLETAHGERISSKVVDFDEPQPEVQPRKAFGSARWVWPQTLGAVTNTTVEFRQTVISDAVTPARLVLAADTVYAIELNGRHIHSGRFPDVPPQRYYDIVPLGDLRKGANELKVRLYVQGVDSFQTLPGDSGLMYALLGRGVRATSGTNCQWRVSTRDRRAGVDKFSTQIGFAFDYDAALPEAAWHDVAAADCTRGQRDFHLEPRPVPRVEELPPAPAHRIAQGRLKGSSVPEHVAAGMDATPMHPIDARQFFAKDGKSVLPQWFGDGFYVLVDLGRETAGYLSLDVDTDAGAILDIGHAEHSENGRIRTNFSTSHFAGRYRAREGHQTYCMRKHRLGARYLQLHVRGVRTHFTLHELTLRPMELPLHEKPMPADLTEVQSQIWKTAVRTLSLCMHEHYEDCPWREQALYGNDGRNQMLCGYYAFDKDNRMPELSLTLLARGIKNDGWLEMCMPAKIAITIPSFTFCWVLSVDDHLKFRHDVPFAKSLMPTLRKVLDTRLTELREGLLPCPTGKRYWHFYEWEKDLDGELTGAYAVPDGMYRYDAALNLFAVLAFEAGARCATATGDGEAAARWRTAARNLRTVIARRFWNDAEKRLETRLGDARAPSELVQALGLLAGAVPSDARAGLAAKLSTPSDWTPVTLSQTLYKYEALVAAGGAAAASVMPAIERDWSRMLSAGATSFWEVRDGWKAFNERASLCHGWSAVPIYFYGAYPQLRKQDRN